MGAGAGGCGPHTALWDGPKEQMGGVSPGCRPDAWGRGCSEDELGVLSEILSSYTPPPLQMRKLSAEGQSLHPAPRVTEQSEHKSFMCAYGTHTMAPGLSCPVGAGKGTCLSVHGTSPLRHRRGGAEVTDLGSR